MNDFCYLSHPTHAEVSTLCKSSTMLWSSNPQAPPTQNRCLTRFALSLSLCSTLLRLDSWAFSSQLLMVETKTRMNIDRGSWLQVQSAALKVNEKTKANENLQKRKWKWIPKVCNNFAIIIYSMKMRRRASN